MTQASISGRVVRTLHKSPAMGTETFWVDLESSNSRQSMLTSAARQDLRILDEQPIVLAPRAREFVLYSRDVGPADAAAEIVARYRLGTLKPKPAPPPLETIEVDASSYAPLADDAFWAFIDVMESSSSETAISRLERALAAEDDATRMSFAQAATRKMFALDHPARTLRNGQPSFDGDESEQQRFGIIAGGKQRYDALIADPASFKQRWLPWYAISLTTIVSSANIRNKKPKLRISTTWSTEPGSNRELWGAEEYVDPSRDPFMGTMSDAVAAAGTKLSDYGEAIAIVENIHEHMLHEAWWAVRLLSVAKGRSTEVVAVFTHASPFDAATFRRRVVDWLSKPGTQLLPAMDFFELDSEPAHGGAVVVIKRRSGLSEAGYVETFFATAPF